MLTASHELSIHPLAEYPVAVLALLRVSAMKNHCKGVTNKRKDLQRGQKKTYVAKCEMVQQKLVSCGTTARCPELRPLSGRQLGKCRVSGGEHGCERARRLKCALASFRKGAQRREISEQFVILHPDEDCVGCRRCRRERGRERREDECGWEVNGEHRKNAITRHLLPF